MGQKRLRPPTGLDGRSEAGAREGTRAPSSGRLSPRRGLPGAMSRRAMRVVRVNHVRRA
jgi:hypothetical protein